LSSLALRHQTRRELLGTDHFNCSTLLFCPHSTSTRPTRHTPSHTRQHPLSTMYHLLRGLHEYLTRKDEYTVVILGLDNVSLPLAGGNAIPSAARLCSSAHDHSFGCGLPCVMLEPRNDILDLAGLRAKLTMAGWQDCMCLSRDSPPPCPPCRSGSAPVFPPGSG
jgi:hypothetical protein